MFNKYNKYIILILISFFVFTQSTIVENMENTNISEDIRKIENKINNIKEKKRKCYINNNCSVKKLEIESAAKELNNDIVNFANNIKTLNSSILSQHNIFNSKINENNELKEKNKKILERIKELELKENSSYGMIETYKKKYYSTIVELVMIIVCVLYLMFLLYSEVSKNNK
jgi:hypothetical protein